MIQTLQALSPAYLPTAFYILLQLPVAVIGTVVVRDRKMGWNAVLKSWTMGQMLCFAVLQVMAVPMILLRWRFNVLFWSYLGVMGVVFGFGVWGLRGREIRLSFGLRKSEWTLLAIVLAVVAAVLIFWQAGIYFFGIHLDEDDARWLAQANDAIDYGQMLTRNFHTGEYTGVFYPERDVTSPWSMMFAVASRILFTTPAIFAHTIYPTIEIWAVYGIYWLVGRELFNKREAQISVVLLANIVNLFFTVTVYTQSTFSLIRVWQGKASVAAVIVPMLINLFICLNKTEKNTNVWIMVIATGCAACLMSGAGIPLSFVAITVLGVYNILVYKQWRKIPLWMISMITPLGSGLLYMFLKR